MTTRKIQEIRTAHASRDGDGVAIQRISGMRHAGMDPILMIDELRSEHRADFAGGFPPHPHRGMQTLTYMKHGGLIHEDNRGNRGEIRSGGAQWMSAGRGIIHSEMPTQDSQGLHGFQLWVNLPAAQKMSDPQYRDVPSADLAHLETSQGSATAIAGNWALDFNSSFETGFAPGSRKDNAKNSLTGPLQELAQRAGVLDVALQPDAELSVAVEAQENVLVYVYDGAIRFNDVTIAAQHMAITQPGDLIALTAMDNGAGFLVLKGEPLQEPVANYGPFVMNTAEEIEQAMADYRNGNFG